MNEKVNPEKKSKKNIFSFLKKGSKENLAALIVPICAVLLLIATLFVILGSVVEMSEDIEIEDRYVTFYDGEKDVTYFLYKGKQVSGSVKGRCDDPYTDAKTSLDGKVLALTSRLGKEGEDCALYAITPSGIRMISDRIDESNATVTVSDNGELIAYTLGAFGSLYVYDVSEGKSSIAVSDSVSEFGFVKDSESILVLTKDTSLQLLDVSSKKIKLLSEKVSSYASLDDGARIVYVTDEDMLFLYTDWSNSTDRIAEDTVSFCVSSDESTFAYTVKKDSGEGLAVTESYFYSAQSSVKLGEEIRIIALDGKGQHVYFEDANGSLYVMKKKKNNFLIFESKKDYRISGDLSEVLYAEDGGTYIYFAAESVEKKISESTDGFFLLMQENEEEKEKFTESFAAELGEDGLFTLSYITAEAEPLKIADRVRRAVLSESGRKVFFDSEGEIFFAQKEDDTKKEKICDGELSGGLFYIEEARDALYLLEKNSEGDTFSAYWCKDGVKKLISDALTGQVYLSRDGYFFFAEKSEKEDDTDTDIKDTEGGYTLYCTKDGGERVHVADNMVAFKFSKASAYIIAPSEEVSTGEDSDVTLSVYGCVKGSKFKVVIRDIFYTEDGIC